MFKKKNFNGVTEKTVENLQLGAGAFFKNFTVGTDTYATAKTAGKCLGATQGGGEFSAKATFRQTEIDGAGGRLKGLAQIDSWDVYIKSNLLETSLTSLKIALGPCVSETSAVDGYTELTGKTSVDDTDYLENITWVGCISGSNNPIIIQVYNAINEDGLTLAVADKSEGKIAVTCYGYNEIDDLAGETLTPPYKIYYPTETA